MSSMHEDEADEYGDESFDEAAEECEEQGEHSMPSIIEDSRHEVSRPVSSSQSSSIGSQPTQTSPVKENTCPRVIFDGATPSMMLSPSENQLTSEPPPETRRSSGSISARRGSGRSRGNQVLEVCFIWILGCFAVLHRSTTATT